MTLCFGQPSSIVRKKLLTPGAHKGQIGENSPLDGVIGRSIEQSCLTRPQDLHAVVKHTAAEANQDEQIVSSIDISDDCWKGPGQEHLPTPLSKQVWRQQGILQIRLEVPHKQKYKQSKSYDDGCDDFGGAPGIFSASEIETHKEQSATGSQKKQTDVVDLADQLPPGCTVDLMLSPEGGRMIKTKEEDTCGTVPGGHEPVCTSPADTGTGDEDRGCQWSEYA